jgi:cation transport protein ChaC
VFDAGRCVTQKLMDFRPTRRKPDTAQLARELWVFAYGSLMWRPGFPFSEAVHARLHGYRRAFCIYSVHYRGSIGRPGLVLGLERGGQCEGIAFRIDEGDAEQVLHYLRAREQISGVYREKLVQVALEGRGTRLVRALTFVAEKRHPSFARALPLARQARVIRGAYGSSGANVDYLINTMQHLAELQIRDRHLERLLTLTGSYFANGAAQEGHRARAKPLDGRQSLRQLKISRSALEPRNRFVHRAVLAGL